MLLAHTRTGLGLDISERTLEDLRTLYQAAVRHVDASVRRLLETLSANELEDETAVIVVGDHGEEFQEHDHLAHYPKLYNELIRVRLLVDVPGYEGRRVAGQVGFDAVPPTVAELLDVQPPDAWTGTSVLPSVRGDESPVDAPVVSVTVWDDVTSQPVPRLLEDSELLVSTRNRDWAYIENVETNERELYHRPADLRQQANLATDPTPDQQDVFESLAPTVTDHASTIQETAGDGGGDGEGSEENSIDDDPEARLRALADR